MSQYLEKEGDLCLNVEDWPVDLYPMDLRLKDRMPTGRANEMAALEAVGLAKGESTEVDVKDIFNRPTGRKAEVKRYILTDAAKPFIQEKNVETIGLNGKTVKKTSLCWGKKALDKIVKWEGPMKFGDYQEAKVIYTYKLNNVADWAKTAEIQVAFPAVKNILDGAGVKEEGHGMKLTNQGWEAKSSRWGL